MSVISDIKMILESNSIHLLYDARLCTEQKERWDAIKGADLVEVVRCKDCKHVEIQDYAPPSYRYCCKYSALYHAKNFYCSMGERREDDKE